LPKLLISQSHRKKTTPPSSPPQTTTEKRKTLEKRNAKIETHCRLVLFLNSKPISCFVSLIKTYNDFTMGGTAPYIRSRKKTEPLPHTTKDPRVYSKNVGFDLMVLLHDALNTTQGAQQATSDPPMPVTAVEETLSDLLEVIDASNINATFVVDGLRNPIKADEDQKRAASADDVRQKLADFYSADCDADYKEVAKLRKKLSQVTQDVVYVAVMCLRKHGREVVVASFEADWQLIWLELSGRTQATYSTDSDMWLLGSKCWICALATKGATKGECLEQQHRSQQLHRARLRLQ
jgi:hypothetical protein